MKKLQVAYNKTLKLTNACIRNLLEEDLDEINDINKVILQMDNYIRSKGIMPVGPLIQRMKTTINEEELDINIQFIRQTNKFINNLEFPYSMQAVIRVPNCMYCRYIGPKEKLNFAYQKIQLEAFENDIPLKDKNYTIFVNQDDDNDTITADVFMERADS